MKRLLLLALTAGLLSSCGYDSVYEANQACRAWKQKGGTYEYEDLGSEWTSAIVIKEEIRDCKLEKETNQVLGFENKAVRKGASYEEEATPERNMKVIERFKY